MFYIAGIGIAVLIELLLITKKNKSVSDKILTVWMFVILVHLSLFYAHHAAITSEFPHLLGIGYPLPLVQGVFLYLYVASLTGHMPRRSWQLALHFLPVTAAYAYMIPFFSLTGTEKIDVFLSRGADYQAFNTILVYAIMASGIVYVSWSVLLLRRHERNIQDRFSDVEKINLRWLQLLTYGLGVIWVLVLFLAGDTLIFAAVAVFVFLIGFFGIRQANIFIPDRPEPESVQTKGKYQKSGLTGEASDELHQELKRVMSQEELFKKSDLSADDLASKLGIHPNHLSQIINQKEGKNFYDFVNSYRIEEFKRLIGLQKNRQYTLLSLAYESGFSSKTSFNRCFRKVTGQTPSAYVEVVAGFKPSA